MTRLTNPSIDSALLDRYVAGDCTPIERAKVAAWIAADPAHLLAVDSLRGMREIWAAERPAFSSQAAWRGLDLQGPQRPLTHPATRLFDMRRWTPMALAASVVLLAGLAQWRLMQGVLHNPPMKEWTTASGSKSTIILRDGTQIVLGPASRLRMAANYDYPSRAVELDGEALFSVVHDTDHPFTVRTARVAVTDVGTVFDIKSYSDDQATRVALLEGQARACSDCRTAGALLRPGDEVRVSGAGALVVTHGANVQAAAGWAQGQLVFDATPIPQVVRELDRMFDLDITIADSSLVAQAITVSFDRESANEVLDAVTRIIGAQYERHGRHIVVRRRKKVATSSTPMPLHTAQIGVTNITSGKGAP